MISGINSGYIRLAFRIYLYVLYYFLPLSVLRVWHAIIQCSFDNEYIANFFHSIGALTVIGLIGSQCCKCSAKFDLTHGRTVNLHRMTGWLRPSDIASCIWKLRRLPGGLGLGIMMVIVSILTLTADLAVNILVSQSFQQGYCKFDIGLVMNWTAGSESFIEPPPNGYPERIASNAQIFSLNNGCPIGIYRKIPWTGNSSFCANEYDIMGTWDCEPFGSDFNFLGDATAEYIGEWLYNNSLQYAYWSYTGYKNKNDQPAQLVVWSSSLGDASAGEPFNVLASVDLNGTYAGTKTMRTYQCNVTANYWYPEDYDHINSILEQMQSNASLQQWADGLEADLYLGDQQDIESVGVGQSIAQRLNSMTMVQGGSNLVNSSALGSDLSWDGDFAWYGCVVNATYISSVIMALVGFTGFCLLTVTFYWITLLFRLGRHALPSFLGGDPASRSIKPVPDSILSWMLQASRENALGSQPAYGDSMHLAGVPRKERELHNWGFSVVELGSRTARMVRTHGTMAPQVEQVYIHVEQK